MHFSRTHPPELAEIRALLGSLRELRHPPLLSPHLPACPKVKVLRKHGQSSRVSHSSCDRVCLALKSRQNCVVKSLEKLEGQLSFERAAPAEEQGDNSGRPDTLFWH